MPTKRTYQYGPKRVRDSRDLRAALTIFAECGRARMEEDGRRRSIQRCWLTGSDLRQIGF
jgi:hypothetical protein